MTVRRIKALIRLTVHIGLLPLIVVFLSIPTILELLSDKPDYSLIKEMWCDMFDFRKDFNIMLKGDL